MLARTFLDAETLGITEPQRQALILTLGVMERGEVEYVANYSDYAPDDAKFSGMFNMRIWEGSHECGTVCCIGGTAELLGNITFGLLPNGIKSLFFPRHCESAYGATVAQAAAALSNYLMIGDSRWEEAMAT